MSAAAWIGVTLLGGIGALARFGLDTLVERESGSSLPLGTLAVNVLGSFVLGVLTGLSVTGEGLFVAGAGALGSFTTFSTWMLETQRLAEDGEGRAAIVNLAGSLAAGLAAAGLGWALGGLL